MGMTLRTSLTESQCAVLGMQTQRHTHARESNIQAEQQKGMDTIVADVQGPIFSNYCQLTHSCRGYLSGGHLRAKVQAATALLSIA